MRNDADDRGQAAIFVIGMGIVALVVTFFAVDATRAFLMRRTLQNAADAAAVAGASQLDEGAYYASGGTRTVLDPRAAEASALDSLAGRGLDVPAAVDASSTVVAVRLRKDLPTPFLRFVGVGEVKISASAIAEPIVSPATPNRIP